MEPKIQQTGNGYSVAMVEKICAFEGKAFLKDLLGLTSLEMSIGSLPEGAAVPFFHKHKQNEEVYVVLAGCGIFTLDGSDIDVQAGSVVRIAPEVSRCTRNTGHEPLVYICIQAKAGSLQQAVADDAIIEQ